MQVNYLHWWKLTPKSRSPYHQRWTSYKGEGFPLWILPSIAVVLRTYFHSIWALLVAFCHGANCVPVYQKCWMTAMRKLLEATGHLKRVLPPPPPPALINYRKGSYVWYILCLQFIGGGVGWGVPPLCTHFLSIERHRESYCRHPVLGIRFLSLGLIGKCEEEMVLLGLKSRPRLVVHAMGNWKASFLRPPTGAPLGGCL